MASRRSHAASHSKYTPQITSSACPWLLTTVRGCVATARRHSLLSLFCCLWFLSGDIELMKSKQPVISSQCKLRRLWRLAVAPQPPIASALRRLLCQLVRGYLLLMLITVRGCVATAGRHSLLSLFCWLWFLSLFLSAVILN